MISGDQLLLCVASRSILLQLIESNAITATLFTNAILPRIIVGDFDEWSAVVFGVSGAEDVKIPSRKPVCGSTAHHPAGSSSSQLVVSRRSSCSLLSILLLLLHQLTKVNILPPPALDALSW